MIHTESERILFNFSTLFNYSKIRTPQGLLTTVPPDFGTAEIHNCIKRKRAFEVSILPRKPLFYAFFGGFDPGEGFSFCIKISRNIDPPYNTGNDFVYADDFADPMARYKEVTQQTTKSNPETMGRYHTNWLNMMYPRLRLAANLLRDDGVIFISIDDAELYNLKKICDEVFGEENYVATLVYDKNRKNDAKYFSVGHEYMLVYFKSAATIYEMGIVLRATKEGIDEVKEEFQRLRTLYNDDWAKVNEGLKALYASWPADDPRKSLARFTRVDEKGPYRDDGNINWPGGGGPMYDVIHPITGKICKKPVSGWRYPTPERLQEEIAKGHVVFGKDETTVPRVRMNLFEADKEVLRLTHSVSASVMPVA